MPTMATVSKPRLIAYSGNGVHQIAAIRNQTKHTLRWEGTNTDSASSGITPVAAARHQAAAGWGKEIPMGKRVAAAAYADGIAALWLSHEWMTAVARTQDTPPRVEIKACALCGFWHRQVFDRRRCGRKTASPYRRRSPNSCLSTLSRVIGLTVSCEPTVVIRGSQ